MQGQYVRVICVCVIYLLLRIDYAIQNREYLIRYKSIIDICNYCYYYRIFVWKDIQFTRNRVICLYIQNITTPMYGE